MKSASEPNDNTPLRVIPHGPTGVQTAAKFIESPWVIGSLSVVTVYGLILLGISYGLNRHKEPGSLSAYIPTFFHNAS
jgi:hypothetical protein